MRSVFRSSACAAGNNPAERSREGGSIQIRIGMITYV